MRFCSLHRWRWAWFFYTASHQWWTPPGVPKPPSGCRNEPGIKSDQWSKWWTPKPNLGNNQTWHRITIWCGKTKPLLSLSEASRCISLFCGTNFSHYFFGAVLELLWNCSPSNDKEKGLAEHCGIFKTRKPRQKKWLISRACRSSGQQLKIK